MGQRKISTIDDLRQSEAFCMVPWVHLFVSQYGTVAPCCLTPWEKEQALGDVNSASVDEIWNGARMREFRRNMLHDKKDKRCWQCHSNEANGLRSKRKLTNFLYLEKFDWVKQTEDDGSCKASKPVCFDIRLSNLCNFKCRICGHHSSSSWFEDAQALGTVSHKQKINRGIDDLDGFLAQFEALIPGLEEVYFAGGEPIIMPEHYRILDLLAAHGKFDVKLRYNTNFSLMQYKDRNLFELWDRFDDVFLHASLDGSGPRGEFQRKGQEWAVVLQNRQRMLDLCPRVDFMLTPTISVFSVLHLPDFHREWTEKGLIGIEELIPHTLKNPAAYDIRVLPPDMKRQVAEKTDAHIAWITANADRYRRSRKREAPPEFDLIRPPEVTGNPQLDMSINEFRNAVTYMCSTDESHLLPKFREMCAELDALRGENTLAVFPELAPMFETS